MADMAEREAIGREDQRMAQYRTCPRCGDHLDHGERCECMDRRPELVKTAKATPPERARGYVIGVDLAQGKDRTAKAYISRA